MMVSHQLSTRVSSHISDTGKSTLEDFEEHGHELLFLVLLLKTGVPLISRFGPLFRKGQSHKHNLLQRKKTKIY